MSTEAFEAGASQADDGYDAVECADVKRRLKMIEEAREFDQNARKQYAADRRRARGDHGEYQINTNLAGSYIDVHKAILYARNPDLDVQPSEATYPPPMADVIDIAREVIARDPKTHEMMIQVGQEATLKAEAAKRLAMQGATVATLEPHAQQKLALAAADPANDPVEIGERAAQAWLNQTIKAEVKKIMEPYRKRLSEAKMFGKTIEISVSSLWRKASLKKRAKRMVGSALTVGIGWLKANWQERTGYDPITARQIADAQAQLDRLQRLKEDVTKDVTPDHDAKIAEIRELLQSLQAKDQVTLARGFVTDFVNAEDVQVSPAIDCMDEYVDSPWIAHRVFMPISEAKSAFPDVADKLGKAKQYHQRRPLDRMEMRHVGAPAEKDLSPTEADQYVTGAQFSGSNIQQQSEGYVCVWEMEDKTDGVFVTLIEGLDYYARKPFTPQHPTKRFYDLFMLAFIYVDGERHPMSLITRSSTLLDEANRLPSNRSEHRRRSIPKTGFDSTALEPKEAERVAKGATGEMVGIKPLKPGTPIAGLFHEIKYAPIDPALYDTRPTMLSLEAIWGTQEALMSSVDKTKTATEAEIQQTGTNARSGYKRSAIDEMLDDLARYTTEVALHAMSHDDVKEIAGPWAFWPEGLELQDMDSLVQVQIKAGSAGKPDTSAQQQQWTIAMPLLENLIIKIGELRQSDPSDIADCLEELAEETFGRMGERMDPSRFLPKEPSNEPGEMPTQPQGQPGGSVPPAAQAPAQKPGTMPANQPPPHDPTQLPVPSHGRIPPGVHQS